MNRPCIFRSLSLLTTGLMLTAFHVHADESEKPNAQLDYEMMKLFVETYEQIDTNYVRDVDRRELMEAAIRGMLEHLDQYSSYIPKRDVQRFDQSMEQEFGGVGIQVNGVGGRLTVISPLPGTPAYRAGVRSGDVIVEVNGESTEGFNVTDAVKVLQGPPGRPVTLGIQRAGVDEVMQMSMNREVIQVPTVLGDHFNQNGEWDYLMDSENKIGFIRMTHFSRHTADEMKRALQVLGEENAQGLILDLRSNPGGLLEAAIEIADMFLESGDIVSVRGRNVPDRSWKARKDEPEYPSIPVAILVNRYSASASEVLSACLQDNHRAIVIGERTWGKGSVQNVIRMESGESALKLTTASYHRPSGVNIHRFPDSKKDDDWGVKPDPGYELSLNAEQWQAWLRDREQRDVIRAEGTEVPERTFNDPQIQKGVEYILEQVAAGK
ncbi:MAG: S41 family peptidase [Planctomycetaceae bacterium]|nr:S41 family peptidase [Planctomycetaceae bacterium]